MTIRNNPAIDGQRCREKGYLCNIMQEIAVIAVFIGSAIYLGRLVYRSFAAKKACGDNCKCSPASSGPDTGSF